jgi:[pyruvate, phosphate dikinase]-phosphate phosphotransferase / [pyruvate, phosphate dikinase] kinase
MSFYVRPTSKFNEEDDEMIQSILGPLGATRPRPKGRSILILSDTTGVTAKSAVEKGLAQFNGCDERYVPGEEEDPCELMQKILYPFVRDPQEVQSILQRATERGGNSIVVFTFADPVMRKTVVQLCQQAKVPHVDLLGPMFDILQDFFQREPLGNPGVQERAKRELTELYYNQVDAIEFTLKADDGMAPWLLPEADVVLVGVSRTGKTPLSVFLSQSQALKVSNIPLVLELDPPKQLFQVDPRRVFCLTLNPIDLQRIRETRLERQLDHKIPGADSNYADWTYLKKDLAKARRISEEHGFTEIDGELFSEVATWYWSNVIVA